MFLDVATGLLLSIVANWYFQIELTFFLVFTCVLFALSPDIDYLIYLFRGGSIKTAHRHRDILHYPLIFVSLGTLILLPLSKEWGILFFLASFWHFFHDSIGIGWGIRWLWPFSKKYYVFFHGSIKEKKKSIPFRFFYAWEPEEIDKLAAKYGNPDWFKNLYLKLSLSLIIEILSFIFALIILYFVAFK